MPNFKTEYSFHISACNVMRVAFIIITGRKLSHSRSFLVFRLELSVCSYCPPLSQSSFVLFARYIYAEKQFRATDIGP